MKKLFLFLLILSGCASLKPTYKEFYCTEPNKVLDSLNFSFNIPEYESWYKVVFITQDSVVVPNWMWSKQSGDTTFFFSVSEFDSSYRVSFRFEYR